jgi:hypothetical protein
MDICVSRSRPLATVQSQFRTPSSQFPPSREAQEQQIGLIDRDKAEDYIRKDAAVIPEELGPTGRDPFYRNLRPYEAAM